MSNTLPLIKSEKARNRSRQEAVEMDERLDGMKHALDETEGRIEALERQGASLRRSEATASTKASKTWKEIV